MLLVLKRWVEVIEFAVESSMSGLFELCLIPLFGGNRKVIMEFLAHRIQYRYSIRLAQYCAFYFAMSFIEVI